MNRGVIAREVWCWRRVSRLAPSKAWRLVFALVLLSTFNLQLSTLFAQDFKAAFYPGRDDRNISTLEFDGVELAAIQAWNEKLETQAREKDARIAALERIAAELKARVAQLAQRRPQMKCV